jgi:hypothetical protein
LSEYKGRIAIGGLLAVAIAVGFGFELTYYFPGITGTTSAPSSSASTLTSTNSCASPQLEDCFISHLKSIESKNASLVGDYYGENAQLTWKGATMGLGGTYMGKNVSILYGSLLPQFTDLNLTLKTYSELNVSESVPVVNATFYLDGHWNNSSSGCPTVNSREIKGMITAQVSYSKSLAGPSWLISKEVWNFVYPFISGQCAR